MTRRHEEKGDETVAFRAPGHVAAWLRERAIIMTACAKQEDPNASQVTASEIMRRILEDQVFGGQTCKGLRTFASNSQEEILMHIQHAKRSIDAAIGKMEMAIAGRTDGRRKTA